MPDPRNESSILEVTVKLQRAVPEGSMSMISSLKSQVSIVSSFAIIAVLGVKC